MKLVHTSVNAIDKTLVGGYSPSYLVHTTEYAPFVSVLYKSWCSDAKQEVLHFTHPKIGYAASLDTVLDIYLIEFEVFIDPKKRAEEKLVAKIDKMLREEAFGDVDAMLTASPRGRSTYEIVALLTGTLAAKSKLANRAQFFDEAEEYLKETRPQDWGSLLLGLK